MLHTIWKAQMKRLSFLLATLTICTYCNGADLKLTIVKDPMPPDKTAQNAVSQPSPASENARLTLYVHDVAQRVEFVGPVPGIQPNYILTKIPLPAGFLRAGPHIAVITHCDTGIVDELNLDTHTYTEFKEPKYLDEKNFLKLAEKAKKGSEKAITATTQDTGEAREFFGHIARHKVTTIMQNTQGSRVSSFEFQNRTAHTQITYYKEIQYQETIDGWYIDLPEPGCAPEYLRKGLATPATFSRDCGDDGQTQCAPLAGGDVRTSSDVQLRTWSGFRAYSPLPGPSDTSIPLGLRAITVDDYTLRSSSSFVETFLVYTGFAPLGLAVSQKTSGEVTLKELHSSKGIKQVEDSWGYTVTEFSDKPLDPELFAVPADFKRKP
jgi:hypothetical protein